MKMGLLWYDADLQAGLPARITRAAERYRQKFGRPPTLCYVNPTDLSGQPESEAELELRLDGVAARIQVVAAAYVLLHHYWLGEGDRVPGGRVPRPEDHPALGEADAVRAGEPIRAPEAQLPRSRPLRAAKPVTGSARSQAGRAPGSARSHLS